MNVVVYSFAGARYVYLGVALGVVLMLLAGAVRPVVGLVVAYGLVVLIDAVIGVAPDLVVEAWSTVSLSFFVFLPTAVYGMLLVTTTTITEMAAALERLRLPSAAVIPLLVMIRFAPAVIQDFRTITSAMRLRGVVGRGNPLRTIEYIYVPLLLGLVRTGEQLTVAALTRGLGLHRSRTFIVEPRFRLIDLAATVVMVALVIAARVAPSAA